MRCYDGCPDDEKWMVFKGWVPVTELGELEIVVEEVLKKERGFMSGQERRAKLIKKGQEAEKAEVVVDIEVDEKKGLERVEKTVQGWVREKRKKTEGSVTESRGRWEKLW